MSCQVKNDALVADFVGSVSRLTLFVNLVNTPHLFLLIR